MSYFFSLFNFVLLYYAYSFFFKLFILKSKKIAYIFFLFNSFLKNQKLLFTFFLVSKKLLCVSKSFLFNKENIYFYFSSNSQKSGLLSLLRSFFIYKKSFEQFGSTRQKYNFFFHSFFFSSFFTHLNQLETVTTIKQKISTKKLQIYIK